MPNKNEKKLDSIFDSTANGATARKPKKAAKPAQDKGAATAPAAPAAVVEEKKAAPAGAPAWKPDKMQVLKTLLKNHEREVLYRKSKEDRMLALGIGLVAALTIGAFLTRAASAGAMGTGWFYSLLFRLVFSAMIGVAGFSAAAMIELNRTRLQDLLATIVKIHENLMLFAEDVFGPGAFLPSTYKFIGSINDDETNYSLLVLKVGAIVAAVTTFLLV